MSDTENSNTAEAPAVDEANKEWDATLVGGNTYTFGGVKYEKGVAKAVDNATKEALEKRAVDHKVVADEYEEDGTAVTEPRQKFRFTKVGEKAEAPRTRQRTAAR